MTPAPPTDAELADAVARFHALVDPAAVHARAPAADNAADTPWVVVWLLVHQRLHGNASLAAAVAAFARLAPTLPPDAVPPDARIADGTLSANTGGYSVARSRLAAEVPEWVADTVAGTLLAAAPPPVAGRRAFVPDGTSLPLPPTAELTAAYPPAGRVGKGTTVGPVARLAVAHETARGCVLRPEVGARDGPRRVSEQALAIRLLDRLPERAIAVGDRNFGIFGFVHAADVRGIGVIARLTGTRFAKLVRGGVAKGPGRRRVCWKPSRDDRRTFDLPADAEVWADVYEVTVAGGTALRPVSTVSVGATTAAAVYKRRGDGETDVRDAKCALDLRGLRGKSADVIRKELAAGVVAHNLVARVRRLAAAAAGVAPRRLSFAGVRSLVGAMLLDHPPGTAGEWVGWFDRVRRAARQRAVPKRPGRSYPRVARRPTVRYPQRQRQPAPQTAK